MIHRKGSVGRKAGRKALAELNALRKRTGIDFVGTRVRDAFGERIKVTGHRAGSLALGTVKGFAKEAQDCPLQFTFLSIGGEGCWHPIPLVGAYWGDKFGNLWFATMPEGFVSLNQDGEELLACSGDTWANKDEAIAALEYDTKTLLITLPAGIYFRPTIVAQAHPVAGQLVVVATGSRACGDATNGGVYAIWHYPGGRTYPIDTSQLLQRTITDTLDNPFSYSASNFPKVRLVSDETINWSVHMGWSIEFPTDAREYASPGYTNGNVGSCVDLDIYRTGIYVWTTRVVDSERVFWLYYLSRDGKARGFDMNGSGGIPNNDDKIGDLHVAGIGDSIWPVDVIQ